MGVVRFLVGGYRALGAYLVLLTFVATSQPVSHQVAEELPAAAAFVAVRISPYDDLVQIHAARYGLDWLMVSAQMWAESSFRADAVSPVGARGLMQVMPSTAGWLRTSPDLLFEPDISIGLGCLYDAKMYAIFRQETGLHRLAFMLAAYNAGPGTVIKAQEQATFPEQWNSGQGIKRHLPHETQEYVPRIFQQWDSYRQQRGMPRLQGR